jgi:polyisoprenyl-teichoic acid--peptidoglycan teichoic acid transferase
MIVTPPKINSKNVNSSQEADDFFANKPESKKISENISVLPRQTGISPKRHNRRTLKVILAIIILIILGFGCFLAVKATNLADKIFVGEDQSLYSKISDLITSQTGNKLLGEKNGQVNVLLLGIGGPGHDGPYLSDTIIVAQLKPKENKATLTSIPRDYLVNTKELGQRKINAVFAEHYEDTKDWDKAGEATIDVVEKISGLEIPYFAVIDFEGFTKTIDVLGGVDVTVDRTFTDYTFPNNSGGYIPAVTFKEGPEHMDGKRALIFARSRHAAGEEGTDYARGLRQQKIISATKEKLTSLNIVADVGKINEMFGIVGDHFHTNLTPGEMIRLYTLTKNYNGESIASLSLDPETGLICPKVLETNGAFVLTLCAGKSGEDIVNFFKESFATSNVASEKAVVWLADSSVAGNLYKKAEQELVNNNITVYKMIYTGKPLTQSVVYPVNQKDGTIQLIKDKLSASEVSLAPPGVKIDPKKVDLIVILGQNPN